MEDLTYKRNPRRIHINMDSIKNDAMKRPKEPVQYTTISIYQSSEQFLAQFDNMDALTDGEMHQLVAGTHLEVLDMVPCAAQNPVYAQKLMDIISNSRYVSTLANYLGNIDELNYSYKVYLNHLLYDYIVFTGGPDKGNKRDIFHLADTVNIDHVQKLYVTGFDRDLISFLCICKYSSLDEQICVKRVNLALFMSDRNMDLQNVVDVYQTLFNSSMLKLFEGIMFDVYSDQDLENATTNQRNIYSLMGVALLEMVNVMPSASIQVILSAYAQDCYGKRVRFSMKLSNDYWRINDMIDMIRNMGIYVP